MADICRQCGTEIPLGSNGCPACGFGSSVKLKLIGSAGEISTAIDLKIGKTLASKIVGDDSRFMDDVQFFLKTRDDKWFLKPYPRIKNPIFINGTEVTGEVELTSGDRISLKEKVAFMNVSCI